MFAQQASNFLKSGLAGRAPGERALLHIACSPVDSPLLARACNCSRGSAKSLVRSLSHVLLYVLLLLRAAALLHDAKWPDQKKMGETPIFFSCQGGRTKGANKSCTPSDDEIVAFF
ncbi:MAG: hypothetical protein EPN70_11055 [Paraburkholderia sp.]|uniref:hypothetical protein n=1 Tax=Paraburkholderia sp. TaxID=1926495 RepID=UPI001208602B|nr:hypothetical protein [Paraburkholderia sp.]TAM04605.1 MAG: hypothetical protein EPN70_11055 [Paraburkholderia sp.]TAM31344.1 MAG: hypothetical protein EPN59_06615 [Paraburkholderia sp.]